MSVLLGDDPAPDASRIRALNAAHARSAVIDFAEMKVSGPAAAARRRITAFAEELPPSIRLFVEIPIDDELRLFMAAIACANACAKIRTGGVTKEAFPPAGEIARFLICCAEHDIRFKATAGLHHPWRGTYPLTYEAGAPTGTMYGFLNVLVAAALARRGATEEDLVAVLQSERGSEFRFDDDELRWRTVRLPRQELVESHATFALSFGSCSFEEPILDLRRVALL